MPVVLPPDCPAIVEPDHLETIWIDGMLAPDFNRSRFLVRCFESVVINRRIHHVVRLRVAMSPLSFRESVRMANAAAINSAVRRPARPRLV